MLISKHLPWLVEDVTIFLEKLTASAPKLAKQNPFGLLACFSVKSCSLAKQQGNSILSHSCLLNGSVSKFLNTLLHTH